MTLVDTSVWVDYLRRGNERLKSLLEEDGVMCHPFVVGELACGRLKSREELLGLLNALPQADLAGHDEALHLLDSRRLFGQGLGWVDLHLLASALLAECELWTLDRPLRRAAQRMRISG